jgi:putative glutathione S-transferase
MGLLIDGIWHDQWYDTATTGGRFVRTETTFRNRITPDGESGFKAETGRYHLYVSLACPWAHRTLIFRKLKRLESIISLSVVDWLMAERGWRFSDRPGCIPDTVNGAGYLYEIYLTAKRDYTGRVTVPVLWDRKTATIVNNESAEIIRMFNSAFDGLPGVARELDFCPAELIGEIDEINAMIYDRVNNGVYKAGFATTPAAYADAVEILFATLDELEALLGRQRFLVGDRLTEADWRLFTTLLRFDPVYVGHFKCNLRRLIDYPNLCRYARALYEIPGVAETVNMVHIKGHYYESHRTINPTGIVPVGPEVDITTMSSLAAPAEVAADTASLRRAPGV